MCCRFILATTTRASSGWVEFLCGLADASKQILSCTVDVVSVFSGTRVDVAHHLTRLQIESLIWIDEGVLHIELQDAFPFVTVLLALKLKVPNDINENYKSFSMLGFNSDSDGQGTTPGTVSALCVPPGEANTATLSVILSTLETMQATIENMQATIEKTQANMSAMQNTMQKEVADSKETQLSIISSRRHPSSQVLGLQNHHKKFHTRLQDVPLEIIVQIFAWIPVRTVLRYRRLSKTINQCLLTREFALLNVQTAHFQKGSIYRIDSTWFDLPEPYQTVYANAMPAQLKAVCSSYKSIKAKGLPESITCLTAVKSFYLNSCKLTGRIPNGIGALQSMTYLDLHNNSLTGPLPGEINLMVALNMLNLTNNQLSGEFPALPNLNLLRNLYIDGNRFTGPIPTVFGDLGDLVHLSASRNRFSIIPATISELENLKGLNISNNPFACEIPPEIWTMTGLFHLGMSNCKLSGSLAGVGSLQQLVHLDVSNNLFSGELPSREIYGLLHLRELHLIGNQFSGGEFLYSVESNLRLLCVDPEFRLETWPKYSLCRSQHDDSEESDTET
ncbi:hypothetical protein CcCBS67573_g09973 [Chytriomyces confervae]|uniref:Uncharacterized protein n=1 Tax=Chytriomyces confervae TaxID=246404 RepID=A0A507DKC6_9FUNG|nr:hypothetical protein CcCBS67573_g09973 [Chytriomyces confervae]